MGNPARRRSIVWQIVGGLIAVVVILASVGELVWCSLYFSDPTNVSAGFTWIVHGSAAAGVAALAIYYARRRERNAAFAEDRGRAMREDAGFQFSAGSWSIKVQWLYAIVLVAAALTAPEPAAMPGVALIATAGILLHELGHAVLAQRSGAANIRIELHPLGGLTTFEAWLTRKEHILIALAGPAAGLCIGVPLLVLGLWQGSVTHSIWYRQALMATLGWSAFNLLPILPLDGATIVEAASGGRVNVLAVSCCASAAGIVVSAVIHQLWIGVVFSVLLLLNLAAVPRVRAFVARWDQRIG